MSAMAPNPARCRYCLRFEVQPHGYCRKCGNWMGIIPPATFDHAADARRKMIAERDAA